MTEPLDIPSASKPKTAHRWVQLVGPLCVLGLLVFGIGVFHEREVLRQYPRSASVAAVIGSNLPAEAVTERCLSQRNTKLHALSAPVSKEDSALFSSEGLALFECLSQSPALSDSLTPLAEAFFANGSFPATSSAAGLSLRDFQAIAAAHAVKPFTGSLAGAVLALTELGQHRRSALAAGLPALAAKDIALAQQVFDAADSVLLPAAVDGRLSQKRSPLSFLLYKTVGFDAGYHMLFTSQAEREVLFSAHRLATLPTLLDDGATPEERMALSAQVKGWAKAQADSTLDAAVAAKLSAARR